MIRGGGSSQRPRRLARLALRRVWARPRRAAPFRLGAYNGCRVSLGRAGGRAPADHGQRAPREEILPQPEGARHRGGALLRGVRVGAHDRGHRLRSGEGERPLLQPRTPLAVPHRHAVDTALRRCALRHHGAAVGHDHQLRGRSSGRRPARHDDRDLPFRVRDAAGARDCQADPRAPRRRADDRLRLLRAPLRHSACCRS